MDSCRVICSVDPPASDVISTARMVYTATLRVARWRSDLRSILIYRYASVILECKTAGCHWNSTFSRGVPIVKRIYNRFQEISSGIVFTVMIFNNRVTSGVFVFFFFFFFYLILARTKNLLKIKLDNYWK